MITSQNQFARKLNAETAIRIALAGLLAFVLGCPQTNSDVYEEGESGESTLANPLGKSSIWLGGCNAFEQQRLVNGEWISQGGDIACLWEGNAREVRPGEVSVDGLMARTPGTWRLSYPIGFGCQPDQPMRAPHCLTVSDYVSNRFEVYAPDDDEMVCNATGGSWEIGSCGDFSCGAPPICLALVPGCNCGPTANFVPGEGCVEDPICVANQDQKQALCEGTGGLWDPLSCGNYSCGERPECTAVIPGCDCGPSSVFDEVLGCLAVPCGAPQGE